MVDQAEIFDAADELVRRGEKPSVRRVTTLLLNGGSPNTIAPLLRAWAQARHDQPADERPGIIDREYEDFLSRVWILARTEARTSLGAARAQVNALDGRLIELETELAEKDSLIFEFRQEREQATVALKRERADRRTAELKVADIAATLSAERVARHAAEIEVARVQAQLKGAKNRKHRNEGPWSKFGPAAELAMEAVGKPMTSPEILQALDPGFRTRLLKALGQNPEAKVRQWLTRRAVEGNRIKVGEPVGPKGSPRFTTVALWAAMDSTVSSAATLKSLEMEGAAQDE